MALLSDQIAVVTGAGSGIGRAIAIALANQGVYVVLVGRTLAKLKETASFISESIEDSSTFAIDLTVDEQLSMLFETIKEQFNRLDLLVLCAGEISHGLVKDASLEKFDLLYRTNIRAPYRLLQLHLPLLKASHGQIVVINSSVGLSSPANVSQFSSTQHALKAITDSLRNEVNSEGIRVLSVYPGRTATPRQELLYANSNQEYRPELLLQPEDIASVVINALALPRTAEVTDINIRPFIKSY